VVIGKEVRCLDIETLSRIFLVTVGLRGLNRLLLDEFGLSLLTLVFDILGASWKDWVV
jgi:hypothetical protein